MKKFNRKAFTLVEIIVVLAIIGVLAAIIVPILVGYTLRSQVISADSTATDVRKTVNNFLTEAEGARYGMKVSQTSVCEGEIVVLNGVWTFTVTDHTVFNKNNYVSWDGSGYCTAGNTDHAAGDSAEDTLLKRIAASLPEVEDAYIRFNLKAGTCNALYMTTETAIAVTMLPFDADGWSADYYEWDTVNQGVCTEGFVVGTSPELKFG